MNLTGEESNVFRTGTQCCICNQEFEDADTIVRDHCHVTGKFRSAAHGSCNLNYQQRERIPVFFHNLKGYEAHHIMSVIGKEKHKKSTAFLSASHATSSTNLAKEGLHKFPYLKSYVSEAHPGNQSKCSCSIAREFTLIDI